MKTTRTSIRNASLGGIILASLVASAASAQVVPTLIQRTPYIAPVMDVANTPPGGFSAEINGSQDFSYDSNPLRVPSGEKSLWGSSTSPELVLREKTPTSLIESTSRIDANVYNRSEFDSVDLHENLFLSHNNERWTASLRALFDRDTTRESEIVNYGSTQARVFSNRIAAMPSLSFQQNAQDKWSITGSAAHDSYSSNAYTDYNFYTVSPTFEHQFNEQNTGRISLNGQRYETASGPNSGADSIGPSIGWTNKATPRLTLHADAGTVYTTTDGTTAQNNDNGNWDYVFSAGITYKGTQNGFDITGQRAHEPFGNGTESLVDSVVAKGTHNVNDTLTLKANADYRKADYDSPQTAVNLDHEFSVGAGLDYKVTKQVSLTADYAYHDENLLNQSGNTNEHVVMLGVAFHPSWGQQ